MKNINNNNQNKVMAALKSATAAPVTEFKNEFQVVDRRDLEEKVNTNVLPSTSYDVELRQSDGKLSANMDTRDAPVSLKSELYNTTPTFMDSDPGSVTISHRELISSVHGTALTDTFPYNFRIQPCNVITFPWLSQIATLFESYTFVKLKFLFVPRVPTSYAGQIGLAIDFDADDTAASSLAAFSQFKNSVIGSIWSGVVLGVEGDALKKCVVERYTDHMVASHAYDPLLHDVGNLRVAVLSPADTSILGQIYVEYTIILRTPEPSPNRPNEYMAKWTPGSTTTVERPFGDSSTHAPVVSENVINTLAVQPEYNVTYIQWMAKIPVPGRYRFFHRMFIPYTAGEWDSTAKCIANISCPQQSINVNGSYLGPYPQSSNALIEISTPGSSYVTCDSIGDFEVQQPDTLIAFIGTWAGTGITTSTYVTTNLIHIWSIPSHTVVTLNSKRFPTLTSSQIAHPLPQLGLGGFWTDTLQELMALARPAGNFLYNRYIKAPAKSKPKKSKSLTKLNNAKKKKSSKK